MVCSRECSNRYKSRQKKLEEASHNGCPQEARDGCASCLCDGLQRKTKAEEQKEKTLDTKMDWASRKARIGPVAGRVRGKYHRHKK